MRSPQLLCELDDVAVRVTNVKGSFTPWSVHRPGQYLYTEVFQPLRFRVDIVNDEADLAAWRPPGFATNQLGQLRAFKKRKLGVVHLELHVAIALDPRLDLNDVVDAGHAAHRIGVRRPMIAIADRYPSQGQHLID